MQCILDDRGDQSLAPGVHESNLLDIKMHPPSPPLPPPGPFQEIAMCLNTRSRFSDYQVFTAQTFQD